MECLRPVYFFFHIKSVLLGSVKCYYSIIQGTKSANFGKSRERMAPTESNPDPLNSVTKMRKFIVESHKLQKKMNTLSLTDRLHERTSVELNMMMWKYPAPTSLFVWIYCKYPSRLLHQHSERPKKKYEEGKKKYSATRQIMA